MQPKSKEKLNMYTIYRKQVVTALLLVGLMKGEVLVKLNPSIPSFMACNVYIPAIPK